MAIQTIGGTVKLPDGTPAELLVEGEAKRRETSRIPLSDSGFVHREWSCDGRVSMGNFQSVIQQLVPTLLRAKGLLEVEGQQDRLLFQLTGIRATLARAPDSDVRGCQLVLIRDREVFDPDYAVELLDGLKAAGRK